MADLTKEKMIEILQRVLKTDVELGFLSKLDENELKTLIASVRERVEHKQD